MQRSVEGLGEVSTGVRSDVNDSATLRDELILLVEETRLIARMLPVIESFEFAGGGSRATTYSDPTGDAAASPQRLALRAATERGVVAVREATERARMARRNLELRLEDTR
jgi:hypothetical protein